MRYIYQLLKHGKKTGHPAGKIGYTTNLYDRMRSHFSHRQSKEGVEYKILCKVLGSRTDASRVERLFQEYYGVVDGQKPASWWEFHLARNKARRGIPLTPEHRAKVGRVGKLNANYRHGKYVKNS